MSKNNFINYNMLNINLQTMLFFLEVAEHQNMTIAANNLHVTQPFLSQRIAALETSLHLKLFERKYHKMVLTQEGELLYKSWTAIIDAYQDSLDEARSLQDNRKKAISIAVWDNISFHLQGKIAGSLINFSKDIKLKMNLFNLINTHAEFTKSHHDILLVADYEQLGENTSIETLEITKLDLFANINKANPLTQKTEISLDMLKDEAWLCTKTSKPFSYQLFLNKRCEAFGFMPKYLLTDDTAQQNFKLLFDEAISVCPAVSTDPASEDIVSVKIKDVYVPIVYAWKQEARPEVKKFAYDTALMLKDIFDSYQINFSRQD